MTAVDNPALPSGADHLLRRLAERLNDSPDELAFRFLDERGEVRSELSWKMLAGRVARIAEELSARKLAGAPVLVAHGVGPELVAALFACWQAGAMAVPAYPPLGKRHRSRFEALRADCGAEVALGTCEGGGVTWLDPAEWEGEGGFEPRSPAWDAPCLLQYTSGSTASPKGVMISQANFSHQLAALEELAGEDRIRCGVSWLPPFHDMGLVCKILQAVWSGFPLTQMSPESFVRRPLLWLQAISRYGADFSGAPNFAFELCLRTVSEEQKAGLDLSGWKYAPMGAERVRAATLKRFGEAFAPCGFREETFYPAYGLAESTLVVSVTRPGGGVRMDGGHVATGPAIPGTEIRVSDGEIQVRGTSVSAGYWRNPAANAELFTGDGFLRTGDLGFLREGLLYVTSRIKDLIVVDGRNLAPEDVEVVAVSAGEGAAAFAVDDGEREQVVLLLETPSIDPVPAAERVAEVRGRLLDELDLVASEVVLVRRGTLSRTTSGKIRRGACRDAWRAGELRRIAVAEAESGAAELSDEEEGLLKSVLGICAEVTGRAEPAAADDPAARGISSLEATRLVALVQAETGRCLELAEVFGARSFAELARDLARRPVVGLPAIHQWEGEPVLTHSQERMWFLHQLDPESAAYHVFGCLGMEGSVSVDLLDQAYRAVVQRHEILRSVYPADGGKATVKITDGEGTKLEFEEMAEAGWDQRLRQFASVPFDLEKGPLIRGLLLSAGDGRQVLGLCAHHVVADGWSARVFLREMAEGCRALVAGSALPVPGEALSYLDYAAWHRNLIESGYADGQTEYWKSRLAGHEGRTRLPTDFSRPAVVRSEGDLVRRDLDPALLERVERFSRERRVTPFMVFLSAFLVFLRRQTGQDDLVVAVPVANRNRAETGAMIGTLVNTLPFRSKVGDDWGFDTLLEEVRSASLEMQANQDAPFEKIIEAVKPERGRDRSPLAQVMFDHQELPVAAEWAGDLRCRPYLTSRGASQFDLSLFVFVLADRHDLAFEYRSDLFREETVRGFLDQYLELLEGLIAGPGRKLGGIDASPSGRTPGTGPARPEFPQKTVPDLILRNEARAGVAVSTPGRKLDYREMCGRARSFAGQLIRAGVRPGDRVALMLPRDADLAVAPLGVWLARACYVPLDPANPAERLAMILEDQAPVTVVTDQAGAALLPAGQAWLAPDFAGDPAERGGPGVSPEAVAYIIYTSGSTGRPKGVAVPHGALANFILSMAEEPGLEADDRLLAVTTLSFDISGLELFLPLVVGATVDLVDDRTARDGEALKERLERSGATVMQATPASWRMLIAAGWKGAARLKVLCGGEAMDADLAGQLLSGGGEVWNMYGPTETTIWSTIWKVEAEAPVISIGRPIANTLIGILDEKDEAVSAGATGELCIGGDGLADGYWQRDELTVERFFVPPNGAFAGLRLYRTGDLARWRADGSVECLGRIDNQVKIRGFRVELGEIDAALTAHPEIAAAATVLLGGERLVAWVTPVAGGFDAADLSRHLRGKLPPYMVPASVMVIGALPLNASGKIDRRALADKPVAVPEDGVRTGQGDSALESEVLGIWRELLGVSDLAPGNDFFSMGGHSLLAVRMVAELKRRTGVEVRLDWLFEDPTVAGLMRQMAEKGGVDVSMPRPILIGGESGNRPIFWMQTLVDGGMGLLPYREAVRRLAPGRRSYGMAEGERVFESISEMAMAHVRSLREVQPQGPYELAGFCFGGNLAVEVAAQLIDAGEKVSLLVLLESLPPAGFSQAEGRSGMSSIGPIVKRLPGQLGRMMSFDLETTKRRVQMKWRALAEGLANRKSPGAEHVPDIQAVLDLEPLDEAARERATGHWEALHRHELRVPDVGRLVLVRAGDEGWLPRRHSLGWEDLTEQAIEVFEVPGRHEEFLRESSAVDVADVVSRVLGGIESGRVAG